MCLQDLNKRQGLALLTKMGESVKHVAGGYKLRARPPEFNAMGEYLDTFSQKLGTIDRIAQRILREQSGILLSSQRQISFTTKTLSYCPATAIEQGEPLCMQSLDDF